MCSVIPMSDNENNPTLFELGLNPRFFYAIWPNSRRFGSGSSASQMKRVRVREFVSALNEHIEKSQEKPPLLKNVGKKTWHQAAELLNPFGAAIPDSFYLSPEVEMIPESKESFIELTSSDFGRWLVYPSRVVLLLGDGVKPSLSSEDTQRVADAMNRAKHWNEPSHAMAVLFLSGHFWCVSSKLFWLQIGETPQISEAFLSVLCRYMDEARQLNCVKVSQEPK